MKEALLVAPVAFFFGVMGIVSLVDPTFTLSFFDAGALGADMRNEVRAVYGGFGVAVGVVLFATLKVPRLAFGARLAIAVALIGMALGRLVSLLVDEVPGLWALVFLGVELAMATMLILSVRLSR